MLVKDVMQEFAPITHPERPAHEALAKMIDVGVHFLPVVDNQYRLVGMVSESDFVRACYPRMTTSWQYIFADQPRSEFTDVAQLLARLKVADIMVKQVTVVTSEQSAEDAVHLLVSHRIHQVPVVDEHGHLLGVITRRNVVKHLLRALGPFVAQQMMVESRE